MIEFELGYNAEVSVSNNYNNETTIKIEEDKQLFESLLRIILEKDGVDTLTSILNKDDILEIINIYNEWNPEDEIMISEAKGEQ